MDLSLLDILLGPAGALAAAIVGVAALAKGWVVPGAEHRALQKQYSDLHDEYLQDLKERAQLVKALERSTTTPRDEHYRGSNDA